ncbi:MAG: hypothetical protein ABEI07_00140, partial [Candidatus Nanohaloarchaea archaeon]
TTPGEWPMSASVEKGYKAALFTDPNYGGRKLVISRSSSTLILHGAGGEGRSAKVFGPSSCRARFFIQRDHDGQNLTLEEDAVNLGLDNDVSSIEVSGSEASCTAKVYTDETWNGLKANLVGKSPNLDFNDALSSFEIYGGGNCKVKIHE